MVTCHPISSEVASTWHLVGRPWLVGCNTFVQRSGGRGRPWLELRYYEVAGGEGRWNATAYKTRRDAILGLFGSRITGRMFAFGGPNPWGIV